jgi:hypothetical protein
MNPKIREHASSGGKARSEKLTPSERRSIAIAAARKRWWERNEPKADEPAPEPEPKAQAEPKAEPPAKQPARSNLPLGVPQWSDSEHPGPLEYDRVYQALLKARKRNTGYLSAY